LLLLRLRCRRGLVTTSPGRSSWLQIFVLVYASACSLRSLCRYFVTYSIVSSTSCCWHMIIQAPIARRPSVVCARSESYILLVGLSVSIGRISSYPYSSQQNHSF